MKNKQYVNRIIENEILKRSKEFPVVVLTGPRQTGKSTLLQHLFKEYKYVTLDNPIERRLAIQDPKIFLENNPTPVIINEMQYAPELLSFIKIEVDKDRSKNGRYILTGSQIFPLMQGINESLAGRVALYELLDFSFDEMDLKKNEYSLKQCFEMIFKGFYPEVCIHKADANAFYRSYIQTYLERDIRHIRAVHDLNVFQGALELIASRCANLFNINEISKESGVSNTTIKNWLSILEATRIIYLLKPYAKNISKRVVKSSKVFFTDTGLLAYILKYPSAITLQHGPLAGAFFENFIIMEVLKHKFNCNERYELYFYRDSNHNEADLVLDFGYKKVVCEIKVTKMIREEHALNLSRISETIGASKAYLISAEEKEFALSSEVQALPWWKIAKILKHDDIE